MNLGRYDLKLSRVFSPAWGFGKRYYSVLVVLVIWDITARLPWVNQYVFPPASKIILYWFSVLPSGKILIPASLTVMRALAGLLPAIVFGIFMGSLMGRYKAFEWFFKPIFSFGFPVPKLALLPLFMHWFGLFNQCKIAMVFVDCLFPIVVYTYHGVKGVNLEMIWSALSKGVRGPRLIWKVLLPQAMPQIYDGIQLGIVVSLLVAFVSEMVSGGGGLGHLMISAYRYMETVEAFASLIMIAIVGFLFTKLGMLIRNSVLFWHSSS
jgi:ABC-type nitrate/sulfonate/bicarbonate transport system permease component